MTPMVRFRPEHARVVPRTVLAAEPGATRADRNELPFPTIQVIADAIRHAATGLNRYTVRVETLEAALSTDAALPPGSCLVGPGSLSMLHCIMAACCAPGDSAVYAWRSFDAFPLVAAVQAARAVEVPLLPDGRHDLAAMAAAIDDTTRLVILCSPNNPNGVVIDESGFETFIAAVPRHVLVLLDAAYSEFAVDPHAVDGLAVLRQGRHENLAVLKTFSKAYGLAGLRLGALYAAPPVIEAIDRLGLMTGVSDLAAAAGLAALREEARTEVRSRIAQVVSERDRIRARLAELGYETADSQTNFVFLPAVFGGAEAFRVFAAQHGVALRAFDTAGVRASVVDPEGNDRLLDVAAAWAAEHIAVIA